MKAAGPQFVMRCGFLEPGRQSALKQEFLTVPPLPQQQDRLRMIRSVLHGWEPSQRQPKEPPNCIRRNTWDTAKVLQGRGSQLLQSQPKHPGSGKGIFTLCFWQSTFRLTVLNTQTCHVQVEIYIILQCNAIIM